MKPVTDRIDWSGTIATAPSTAFVDASLINSTQTELENAVLASGQTLDEANNYQLARSITDHALGGGYSVDTGTVNNYILSITGSRYAPTTLVAGYVLEFFTGNANTTTTPTLNYATLGVKTIVAENGTDAILAGDIKVGVLNRAVYDGTKWRLILPKVPSASQTVAGISYINKQITIANNVTDANNDIDFTSGTFTFSDYTGMASVGAMTKRLDASWTAGTNNGGLDTGSKANSTWYHSYAIYNPTSGVSDFIFSTNATTPTLPSGYTKYKLIESIYVLSSGAIMSFKDMGDRIVFSPVTELSTGSGTILNTLTIRSPLGRNIKNIIYAGCQISSASAYSGVKLFSGDGLEMGEARGYGSTTGGGNLGAFGDAIVQTNLLSQIKYQGYGVLASITIYNYGWLKDLNL